MSTGEGRVLDRDAIVAAADLPALADAVLGPRAGSASSPVWPCPGTGHDPTSPFPPEISVLRTRRGDQRWACQNCGADGTAIDLVMASQRLGFRDALEFLARRTTEGPHGRGPAPNEDLSPIGIEGRTGSDAWVAHASQHLWEALGHPVRHWLIVDRGLPEDVLRQHRVGATTITPPAQSLSTRRAVAGRRSSSPAAVLPVVAKGRAVFAQLRLIDPPAGAAPYLNAPVTEGQHPRLGLYRPPRRVHPEIVVTEGIIDALSANAAGYRAAAILAPGLADAATAVHLARLQGPLVLALDPDDAGGLATDRLASQLWARGRRPALLAELGQDLNDTMRAAGDWPRKLTAHVRAALASGPPDRLPEL
jgi:DNA primase